jgi:hypothetical protein
MFTGTISKYKLALDSGRVIPISHLCYSLLYIIPRYTRPSNSVPIIALARLLSWQYNPKNPDRYRAALFKSYKYFDTECEEATYTSRFLIAGDTEGSP